MFLMVLLKLERVAILKFENIYILYISEAHHNSIPIDAYPLCIYRRKKVKHKSEIKYEATEEILGGGIDSRHMFCSYFSVYRSRCLF